MSDQIFIIVEQPVPEIMVMPEKNKQTDIWLKDNIRMERMSLGKNYISPEIPVPPFPWFPYIVWLRYLRWSDDF